MKSTTVQRRGQAPKNQKVRLAQEAGHQKSTVTVQETSLEELKIP